MSKLQTDKSVTNTVNLFSKTWRSIWRFKFIISSVLIFLSIFLFLRTGWLVRNLDRDIQRAAESDSKKYEKFSTEIRLKLLEGKFDLLDNIADELRASKTKFPGGAWKLQKFYYGVADVENGGKASEAEWKAVIGKLQQWVNDRPNSITARVALGQAYVGYAWKARGRGYANTVTEEGNRLFRERLDKAEQLLNEANQLPGKCPNSYYAMQMVALGQSWSLERYNELFEEAIKLEPLYHYFYENKATFLMPRWYGNEGDWERFADEVYEKTGGKEGSMLYCNIVWSMSDYYDSDKTFLDEVKVSWPKLRQGFIDKETLQGTSNSSLNKFCFLACMANDRPTAQALFARIGDDYDPYVWGQERKFYNYKSWASDKLIDKLKIFLLT
jgi:hypothetical protein